ncbi:MAG TPA: anthrone oxygenase family protein [Rhizobium sp.]|nr:anthrone oxygenase family protein [Rhizobium sp.]
MVNVAISVLLWFSAIGCGLLAGLYFAFSTFIMRALDRTGAEAGAAAMNSINVEILRSTFMPFFLGTTVSSAILALIALLRWGEPGSLSTFLGGMLYVVGMFGVTMVFNVPLNNRLAKTDSGEVDAVWRHYLDVWTRWNHVRTLTSTAASALFIAAIAAG